MSRQEEILKLFDKVDSKKLILNSVTEMLYLEANLTKFKKVLQETPITPATKDKYKFYHNLYKDSLIQYTQLVKTLCSLLNKEDGGESSPLQDAFKDIKKKFGGVI